MVWFEGSNGARFDLDVPLSRAYQAQYDAGMLREADVAASAPPQYGPGSSTSAWVDYAQTATGDDGWDGMSRGEIVAELEARGVEV